MIPRFTRERSLVQAQPCPLKKAPLIAGFSYFWAARPVTHASTSAHTVHSGQARRASIGRPQQGQPLTRKAPPGGSVAERNRVCAQLAADLAAAIPRGQVRDRSRGVRSAVRPHR